MQQGIRVVMPRPFEVEIQHYDIPEPGPGQLLVKHEASAISAGTELAVYTGVHQWLNDPSRTWPRFPFTPGYSGVGHVAQVGNDVTSHRVGDRIIYEARHESYGLVNVAGRALAQPIADHVPARVAAFATLARFPLTALVQSGAVVGQAVAVFGLGTIGQIALRLFSAARAYPLIGIDPVAERRAVAAATPGVACLDTNSDDHLQRALRELNGGQLPDVVVEATGVPNTVNAAMQVVADGGRVVMVGSPRGIAGDVDFYWNLHGRSIQLIGAHGSAIGLDPREKFPFVRDRAARLLVHLLESGKVTLDDMITHDAHGSESHVLYEGLLKQRDLYLGVAIHW